jgi:glycosyltransferase involved in cell wall biosynthesis
MKNTRIRKIGNIAQATLQRLGYKFRKQLYYVAPEANWSIDWDAHYITNGVSEQSDLKAQVVSDPRWLVGQLVHYGSLWAFLGNLKGSQLSNNTNVVTVFHGNPDDERLGFAEPFQKLMDHQASIHRLVVSNRIMEQRFLALGFAEERIARVPLGVDLSVFRPGTMEERRTLRQRLSIPDDAFCIGSFHKDGDGWEEGLNPKLVKGPDVLLKTIDKLRKKQKVHVLLTAPARGYVIKGLEDMGVSYTHRLVERYQDLASYYHALDVYLVPSREEGGPKGILESLASGVPLVSTKVGLAPDVIEHGKNGLLAESEDASGLAKNIAFVKNNPEKAEGFAAAGLESIKPYDWKEIAAMYYQKVYKGLL